MLTEKVVSNRPLMDTQFFSQFRAPNEGRSDRDWLRRAKVCKDIDWSKALRRNSYNPNTLARDVLISKGLHPTERPLNQHLAQLRTIFSEVTNKSDLSTFRWDLVDPGGDAQPEVVESIEKDAPLHDQRRLGDSPPRSTDREEKHGRQFKSILSRGGGVMRGRIAQPSRGRGGLVSTHTPMRKLLAAVDASHGNQDNPTEPVEDVTMDSDMADTQDEISGLDEPAKIAPMMAASADVLEPTPNPRVSAVADLEAPSSSPRSAAGSGSSPAMRGSTPKRRGRPPGSRNKTAVDPRGSGSPSHDQPRRRGRPPGTGMRGSPSSRGRGRPPKPRPEVINRTMPSDGIGVMLAERDKSEFDAAFEEAKLEPAKKRRNWKGGNIYPDSPDSDEYVSFKCAWQGCQNKGLHNLDTLRRHVLKVHVPRARAVEATGDLLCAWARCPGDDNGDADDASGPGFAGPSILKQHIEDTHMHEIALRLGDGPDAHPSGE